MRIGAMKKQSQNKPNFRNVQMAVKLVKTMTNNNEPRTMNYAKQTQSNPTEGGSKPTLSRRPVRRSFSEDGSLGEGGFKPLKKISYLESQGGRCYESRC